MISNNTQLFVAVSSRSALFIERGTPLGLQSPFAAGPAGARGDARNLGALGNLQAFCHALKCHLAVSILRTPLSGRDHQATGNVNQAHARLHLVAMLPTRPTRNKKLDRAIAFE